jgi:rSAM/selenodomain-associated transferase 2
MLLSVSVIIPTLNEEKALAFCLKSLYQQTLLPLECIVVDGGSQDQTARIAQEFPCTFISSPLRGRALQMNLGAKKAQGDVLLFLHADTLLLPHALAQMVGLLLENPKGVGGAFFVKIDAPQWIYKILTFTSNLRCAFTKHPYGDQGIFVRRTLFQKVGGFPESCLFEEILLVRQLKPYGSLLFVQEPTVSISARRWQEEGVFYAILRNFLLTLGFYLHIPPQKLVHYYPVRRVSSSSPSSKAIPYDKSSHSVS